jgi:hypothetical protein
VRGTRLLMKRDMRRFKKLCKDGHLIPEDYKIYKDWSSIDKSRERYIRIKDGLLLEGEVQDMNDKENFYDEEPYKERVCSFSWRTTMWLPINAGSCFARQTLSVFVSLR